jgi:hypothetical protein
VKRRVADLFKEHEKDLLEVVVVTLYWYFVQMDK